MAFALDYEEIPEWPLLSWLAVCEPGHDRVLVFHGRRVETNPYWFCEAVWDGPYGEADFDRTDLVYGSGARCRDGKLCFVSSGATTDRLQYLERDGLVLVSNSLACLLAFSDSDPAPQFRGYIGLFSSIARGFERCDHQVPLVAGFAELVYFLNLEWDGRSLRRVPKAVPRRDFGDYERYVAFLRSGLEDIAANMACPERRFPYDWLGTLSRGYDSPTTVALAKDFGLKTALTFHASRPGVRDDGVLIAEALGVEAKLLNRLEWQKSGVWEPTFLAGDGQGKEIMLSAASPYLEGRVFATGFAGDFVWSLNPNSLTTELARDGYAGLSLTEFRLHRGFVDFPLPYMGMTQVADICRISRSPEMHDWDIGGGYSRPICRRILEERGVPGELFGRSKTGASVRFVIGEDPWSPSGHRSFLTWIMKSPALSDIRPARRLRLWVLLSLLHFGLTLGGFAPRTLGRIVRRVSRPLVRYLRRRGLEDFAFLWGMDRTRQSYRGCSLHRARS